MATSLNRYTYTILVSSAVKHTECTQCLLWGTFHDLVLDSFVNLMGRYPIQPCPLVVCEGTFIISHPIPAAYAANQLRGRSLIMKGGGGGLKTGGYGASQVLPCKKGEGRAERVFRHTEEGAGAQTVLR